MKEEIPLKSEGRLLRLFIIQFRSIVSQESLQMQIGYFQLHSTISPRLDVTSSLKYNEVDISDPFVRRQIIYHTFCNYYPFIFL